PGPKYFGAALEEAIERGEVAEADLDRAVARIVAAMVRFGLVGDGAGARPERDREAARGVARRVAEAGAVLLRNEGGALPLTGGRAADLAVIGAAAAAPKVTGPGGAAGGDPRARRGGGPHRARPGRRRVRPAGRGRCAVARAPRRAGPAGGRPGGGLQGRADRRRGGRAPVVGPGARRVRHPHPGRGGRAGGR